MKARLIQQLENKHLKDEIATFAPGDTIRVNVRITERAGGDERVRLQPFEGVVIGKSGTGLAETVTVRRVTYGVGVERTFPVHAPVVDSIDVLRRGKVRKAKLYYLRGRSGRASRIRERIEKVSGAAPADAVIEEKAEELIAAAGLDEAEEQEVAEIAEAPDADEATEEVVAEDTAAEDADLSLIHI